MDAALFAEFRNAFESAISTPPDIGSIIKYNAVRNSGYEHIIFVEGNGDKLFYSHSMVNQFTDNAYYIFASATDQLKGKDSVMKSFDEIYNNSTLSSDLDKCIFLVDRDWDNRIDGNHFRLQSRYVDYFTVTYGHSMENYFLEEENLRALFEIFGNVSDLDSFVNEYYIFAKETSKYWGLKSAKIYADKHGIPARYSQIYAWDDIFDFTYSDGHIDYRRDYFETEMSNLENTLKNNAALLEYAEKKTILIANNPRMVRGHQAFDYLSCYFNGRYGVELVISNRPEFRRIFDAVKKFQVKVDGKVSK